jgi:hypothetical protein
MRFVTLLGLYPQSTKADKNNVYRVDHQIGWINGATATEVNLCARHLAKRLTPLSTRASSGGPYDLLVLHDTAAAFREQEVLKAIIDLQLRPKQGWIIWHMYSPLAEGPLWDTFEDHPEWLDRTIIVINMECVRQAGMDLPQITSLEQESALFSEGMLEIKSLTKLARARLLVAHQHREGILLYHRPGGLKSSCYYCPHLIGDALPNGGGVMVGYSSILVAAIVRGLAHYMRMGKRNLIGAVIPAVKQSVVLDHIHYLNGFGTDEHLRNTIESGVVDTYDNLFSELPRLDRESWQDPVRKYFVTALSLEGVANLKTWSRIDGFIQKRFDLKRSKAKNGRTQKTAAPLDYAVEIASDVVRRGLRAVVENTELPVDKSLPHTPGNRVECPYHLYGVITTAYREEIDGFANIQRIIERYLSDDMWTTPLSVAVFGQPGSGKSLAVKQILQNIDPEIAKRPLSFNMSQMNIQSNDLEIAFHKVQDEAVRGTVPLVFFDEFDAGAGNWLRFFLAPMQDGEFKAGESTYRIGKAIFVFAGGIAKKWDEFYEQQKDDPKFKDNKGPDFVSRLRGYLEIQSINPRNDGWVVDNVVVFRRAILLRSLLERHLPEIIDESSKEAWIDPDVVRELLLIPRYEHEVRSMEAIVQMSRVSPRGKFHRSSLPTEHQMKMHIRSEAPNPIGKDPEMASSCPAQEPQVVVRDL